MSKKFIFKGTLLDVGAKVKDSSGTGVVRSIKRAHSTAYPYYRVKWETGPCAGSTSERGHGELYFWDGVAYTPSIK